MTPCSSLTPGSCSPAARCRRWSDTLVADGVRLVRARVDARTLIEEAMTRSIIFAAGAWLPSLLPELLGEVIMPTRQEVFFFGTPPGDDSLRTGADARVGGIR